MTKLWTSYCYSIKKVKRSVKIFPDFPLSALTFQEISLSFPGFPCFFNFSIFSPDFPGFLLMLWALVNDTKKIIGT